MQFVILFALVVEEVITRPECGCKNLRPCYEEMIDDLKHGDEVSCVESAAIGTSTIEVYLRALQTYCSEVVTVKEEKSTFEGRSLFEVILEPAPKKPDNKTTSLTAKPTILLEAGQLAGTESVGLALYFIEQLVGCNENADMLNNVRWVVLPCTNPDGMEYAKNLRSDWHKNQKSFSNKPGIGVDISRNFDYKFNDCHETKDPISPTYPGEQPNSEFESEFVTDVITRCAQDLKAYVSIRRNGHSILYPYAGSDSDIPDECHAKRAAEMMALKANHKVVAIQQFENMSIYDMNGERQCGSSVDYAFSKHVKIALEMRVFLGDDNSITSMFQNLPRGYNSSLRLVYYLALKELYNIIVDKLLNTSPPQS